MFGLIPNGLKRQDKPELCKIGLCLVIMFQRFYTGLKSYMEADPLPRPEQKLRDSNVNIGIVLHPSEFVKSIFKKN